MFTKGHLGSSEPDFSFHAGDDKADDEYDEWKRSTKGKQDTADAPANRASTKGGKDKGVQYLLLSVAGYLCASIVFGFLFNNKKKRTNANSSDE